jgi:hypothetical protein
LTGFGDLSLLPAENLADLEQGHPFTGLVGVEGGIFQQAGQQGIFQHGKIFPQRILQGKRRLGVNQPVFFGTLKNIIDHFVETAGGQLASQTLDDLALAVDAQKRIGRQRDL